jgi:hypothetical protein
MPRSCNMLMVATPARAWPGWHACLVQEPEAASPRLFREDPHVPARPGCSKPRVLWLAAARMHGASRQPCRTRSGVLVGVVNQTEPDNGAHSAPASVDARYTDFSG